ncbi:MAG: hypothetical protein WBS18_00120 [Candidatus Acidiferrales bacterium]
MKNSKIIVAFFAVAAATVMLAPEMRAQSVDTTVPMVVKQNRPRPVWMKARVVRADGATIVVRNPENEREIHTFTYSGKSLAKIQQVLADGGYQVGDRVKILYQPGDTVALDLRGKPSKAL